MPYVPTCQRVLCAHVPTCQRALCAYVLTCQRLWHAHVLTCLRALRGHVLSCQSIWRVYVLTYQCALRALRAYMLTCYNWNDKDKFSITCFPYILRLFFVFFLWNKTVVHFCISLTSQKPLTDTMTNIVKWNSLNLVWV